MSLQKHLTLLLGGARSGKSSYAERWASEHAEKVLFVATAQAFDSEMHERITAHQASRPTHWTTLEVPLQAGSAIQHALTKADYELVVLDCVTLLASNTLLQLAEDCSSIEAEAAVLTEIDTILQTYASSTAAWLIISNEVGMGLVPPYRLGRLFRDALGRANQRLAQNADEVLLFIAGLPWRLTTLSS